jgi:hypothetical protein
LHISKTRCALVLDALIDEFWSDPLVQGVPRISIGENTVVVPDVQVAAAAMRAPAAGRSVPANVGGRGTWK